MNNEGPCTFEFPCSDYHEKCQATADELRGKLQSIYKSLAPLKCAGCPCFKAVDGAYAKYKTCRFDGKTFGYITKKDGDCPAWCPLKSKGD